MPIGTSILGLRSTGDFGGKKTDAQKILELYTKLGDANGIMPTALAWSLDRELRTEGEIEDLGRQFRGKLHFLPRRCFENYLLDAEAIAAVLSKLTPEAHDVSLASVQDWLERNAKAYHPEKTGYGEADFELRVDGARLLTKLFSDLSETAVSFWKAKHSVELTEWLLNKKPRALCGLTDYAIGLLEN